LFKRWPDHPERASMAKPVVVIVDDDEDFLDELGDLIGAKGYDVTAVSDPLSAVDVIETTEPDVVLLDLKMDEKDGFVIAGELSANPATAKIPIIVMTGYYDQEQLERLKSSGVIRSFLTKPPAVSDLMEEMKKVREEG
jgi:CheY-like chemotaxis protein